MTKTPTTPHTTGRGSSPITEPRPVLVVTAANGTRWHRPASEAPLHLAAGRLVEWVDGWEFPLPTKWAVR